MAETTRISWCDSTFNPWVGCSRVSPGYQNCYAEQLMDHRYQKVAWGPGRPRLLTKTWNNPIKWNREAERTGVRRKVFCGSLCDWLDAEVPDAWLIDLMGLIQTCPHLDWLMLTKRPELAFEGPAKRFTELYLPNVWFGVSVENQKYWDLRVPQLLRIPAAVHWVSYEPALGPLESLSCPSNGLFIPDWLVIGGESSQGEPGRPFAIEWAESAIAQCRSRKIAPFMKQVGSRAFYHDQQFDTKDRAGADSAEWPESIRVREFPQTRSFA